VATEIKLFCLNHALSVKSPMLNVGLFCFILLVGCRTNDNPDDVAITFWTALSEHDLETAQQYSTEQSVVFFKDEKIRNASFQIGRVRYICDGASVETWIARQSAETSSAFKTYLIHDSEEGRWKVDYPHTLKNIDQTTDKRFKNVITSTQESSKSVSTRFLSFMKDLGKSFVQLLKNMKERLKS
jgi:hypothetical protein